MGELGGTQAKSESVAKGSTRVSGVLLAAGESTRMGEGLVKQLLPVDSEPLVRHIARQALTSRLCQVVVVVGFASAEVQQALAGLGVSIIHNPHYAGGQSTSVKAGLGAVDPASDAAMFLPVDHPFLTSAVMDQLIAAYQVTGGPIVLPVYKERQGAPVVIDRSLFRELAEITGDEGGRQLFHQHPDEIVSVPLDSEQPLLDIDTPDDYRQLLQASLL